MEPLIFYSPPISSVTSTVAPLPPPPTGSTQQQCCTISCCQTNYHYPQPPSSPSTSSFLSSPLPPPPHIFFYCLYFNHLNVTRSTPPPVSSLYISLFSHPCFVFFDTFSDSEYIKAKNLPSFTRWKILHRQKSAASSSADLSRVHTRVPSPQVTPVCLKHIR